MPSISATPALPTELWLQIGHHVLEDIPVATKICLCVQPAITRVNRALRSELLRRFYRTKIKITALKIWMAWMEHDHVYGDFVRLRSWLHAIGPRNRENVTGITLELNYDQFRPQAELDELCEKTLRETQAKLGLECEPVRLGEHIFQYIYALKFI